MCVCVCVCVCMCMCRHIPILIYKQVKQAVNVIWATLCLSPQNCMLQCAVLTNMYTTVSIVPPVHGAHPIKLMEVLAVQPRDYEAATPEGT